MQTQRYDVVLVLSFGGPEKREDVIPFLENVLRGRNVPRERMLEVAEHYYEFGGKSPINDQCRELIAALEAELSTHGPPLPIYWGNRNWHPMLADTVAKMRDDGVQRALAFATSAWSSYSGCRQYREDIARAIDEVGEGAPAIEKIRPFFNHPGFIEAMASRLSDVISEMSADERAAAELVFTAHSIPHAMAAGCEYAQQVEEASRLVAEQVGHKRWSVAYQSRSGPPSQSWLEPDICDRLADLARRGVRQVVVVPVGFVSDHMEVVYDLDHEARAKAKELEITMRRCPTVGTHPRFVQMIRELIEERLDPHGPRSAVGCLPARPDICPADCCPQRVEV